MELHHLHVLEPNARPIRERHTIAGTDVAVGGERVDASEATRGEDHRLCRDRLESTTPHVDRNHAQAPRILDQELGGEDLVMAVDLLELKGCRIDLRDHSDSEQRVGVDGGYRRPDAGKPAADHQDIVAIKLHAEAQCYSVPKLDL